MSKENVSFSMMNVYLTLAAIVLVLVGFMLMSGPGTSDTTYNPDIFSFRRIVVAPVVCLAGYLFMVVAIMWRPKKKITKQ